MDKVRTQEHTAEVTGQRQRPLGTRADGARRLNMRLAGFDQARREGLLPPGVVVQVGRRVRVDLDALEAWIAAGGQGLAGGWRREPSGGSK